jgi:hypothetical protein
MEIRMEKHHGVIHIPTLTLKARYISDYGPLILDTIMFLTHTLLPLQDLHIRLQLYISFTLKMATEMDAEELKQLKRCR